jgi:ABC-type dipeptide/oligopeptide/nickel transport system ATPase subunit
MIETITSHVNLVPTYFNVRAFVDDPHEENPLEGKALPEAWPSAGAVSFHDVVFQYQHEVSGKAAINHLSVGIPSRCNTGIVGGRGSGKSTLVNLLFCLGKLTSGSVTIDGEELAGLNKRALRRQLGMIPQKPVIFTGTIRDNLCPPITVRSALAIFLLHVFHPRVSSMLFACHSCPMSASDIEPSIPQGDERHGAMNKDSAKMLAVLKNCRLDQLVRMQLPYLSCHPCAAVNCEGHLFNEPSAAK